MTEELKEIAISAGDAILQFYNDEIETELKANNSPLTKADLAAHHVIVDSLARLTPETPVISEEGGIAGYHVRKKWKSYWLVDPLDGTKEFIKKNGEFTVNIALIENNTPVLGIVYIPAKGVIYTGEKGKGAFKQKSGEKTVRIYSQIPDKSKLLTIVSSRSHGSSDMEDTLSGMGITVGNSVVAGSSLKFCLVAEGTADIYPRMGPTMEWDTAAGDAVYRYSGKSGTRRSPLSYNKPSLKNDAFIIGLD